MTKKYITTRTVYKAVKKYDHRQFDEFCTRVYVEGYNDALEVAEKDSEPSVSIEEVLGAVEKVKGVGPALAGKIKIAVTDMIAERGCKDEKQTERLEQSSFRTVRKTF